MKYIFLFLILNYFNGVNIEDYQIDKYINSIQEQDFCLNNDILDYVDLDPYHILINKENLLSEDYVPNNLTLPNVKYLDKNKVLMEETAAKALENMFNDAYKQNINLIAISGYRSYDRQVNIYNNNLKKYGEEYTNKVSAKPGTSEHQTGLVIDVSSLSNNYNLNESFSNTPEGIWLMNNSHKYGFIIRYPKDKQDITGYIYEPWHIRYVGKDLSTYIYINNLTLEEYIQNYKYHKENIN